MKNSKKKENISSLNTSGATAYNSKKITHTKGIIYFFKTLIHTALFK